MFFFSFCVIFLQAVPCPQNVALKQFEKKIRSGIELRSVSRAFVLSQAVAAARSIPDSGPTNACVQVRGLEQLGCHDGCQEVIRCRTRGESEESTACR